MYADVGQWLTSALLVNRNADCAFIVEIKELKFFLESEKPHKSIISPDASISTAIAASAAVAAEEEFLPCGEPSLPIKTRIKQLRIKSND